MIGNPVRISKGEYFGIPGVYWVWPIDGYFDLHHADEDAAPDGSDVVGEGYASIPEAKAAAHDLANLDKIW